MAFLGYALFSGEYGEFTIPVIEVSGFTLPTGLEARILQLSDTTFNSITWSYLKDIFAMVDDPPKSTPTNYNIGKPFSSISTPLVQISPSYNSAIISGAVFPDDFYESVFVWIDNSHRNVGTWEKSDCVVCIFKLTSENNKYFLVFQYDDIPSEIPSGISARFIFTQISTNESFDEITIQSNPIPASGKKAVKFYCTSPQGTPLLNRGESIDLQFAIKYSDGSVDDNVPFTYEQSQPDAYGITNWTIAENTLTVTEQCWYASGFIRFHSELYPDLEYEFTFHVRNPQSPPGSSSPYLPEGGGISGGGNQSSNSNITGGFDADPGPSIVENLPYGSSGSDIASSGMYTKYLCNNVLLNILAQFFWEDNLGIQALKAVFGNPIDSIISLNCYPFALDTLVPTTSTTIYFGKYNSGFAASSLTKSSFQIDWGSVTIPFFWGSFLDYAPYTKIQLYLPWGVGFVGLDPNEVMPWSSKNSFNQTDFVSGTVRVITNIELDKGSCVHNVVGNNGRVIGSFGGIVGKQIPLTGSDTSGKTLALIGAAISAGTTAAMAAGGYPGIGKGLAYSKGMSAMAKAEGREMLGEYSSAVSSTLSSTAALAKAPISYPRAGSFSDATNTLAYQYPYLIISRPSQSVPQQYGRFMGYPSNIFHNHLGEVRGYTEVSSIHLDDIPATSNELDELESILKGGVLL